MSSTPIKTSALSAIFLLATVYTISVSAQTSSAVNKLIVKPASARSTDEPVVNRKAVPLAQAADSPAGPELAEIHSGADDSGSTRPDAAANATVGVGGTGRGATVRNATTSPQTTSSEKWQFQFSPYFWMASLHGTAGVGNRTTQVDESFSDIFHSLDFALMGVFEARKGKLVVLTDMEYVAVSDDKATPGPLFSDVNAKFKIFIFEPDVGYRLYEDPDKGASIDVLGGIRVWHVSTELNFGAGILPATQVQGSRNWVDAVAGLRGKMALSEKLFLTGKFDLGGGGSKFTWQLFGGGGYNVNQKVALILGYRVLDVNYGKNNFIYDMNQRGPIMGVGFKF